MTRFTVKPLASLRLWIGARLQVNRFISDSIRCWSPQSSPFERLYGQQRKCHFELQKMSTFEADTKLKPLVAVCQMTSTSNKDDNFKVGRSLIEKAKIRGAQMVFLPECFDFVSNDQAQAANFAESLDGDYVRRYCDLAKEFKLWLSLGGFHEKGPPEDPNRIRNTHILIDDDGAVKATYSKTHLFDLMDKGKRQLSESDTTIPGPSLTPPVSTPAGKVGLAVCYDMRFPELSIALCQQGAEILTFPSAFTVRTGMAHWHTLLRSRAIESQCYVVAAAQVGRHSEKRTSYGHAVIVDPWGAIIAECKNHTDVAFAEIDLDYLKMIRQDMPLDRHRRHDLYGYIVARTKGNIDEVTEYDFGQFHIKSSQVFMKSALSIGFVNLKPVVPGHVLVAPIRVVEKFADLSQEEVADLFDCVGRITKVIENAHSTSSSTVTIQNGPDAGQTVPHVHVHVLPRKPGDFAENDDVYTKLQHHDEHLQRDIKDRKVRTEEEMAEEAANLRKYFC